MPKFTFSFILAICLLSAGVGVAVEQPPEKTITLINAAGISAEVMTQIQAYAQKQLRVPVRTQTVKPFKAKTLRAFAEKLQTRRRPEDVCLIALVPGGAAITLHATVERDLQTAMVNVGALKSDDPEKTRKRLQRHVMRGAGFLFGLKPAPDPFCATRHYRTLEDLDKMGMNFCPPYQGKFKAEAMRRGLADLTPARRPLAK